MILCLALVLVCVWRCAAYSADKLGFDCAQTYPDDRLASTECLVRALALVSEQQMSVAQYMYIAKHVVREPCNLLVFGVGGDSPIWLHANERGRTLFVEQDAEWARLARERSSSIEVEVVRYRTRVAQAASELNDVDARYWDFLPTSVAQHNWTVILIDAPTAYDSRQPGRLQPVWFAARHVAERRLAAHVFLHDYERAAERRLGQTFFTLPFQTQPVVVSAPTRQQHLAHWALTDAGNQRGALARSLHTSYRAIGGRRTVLLNVLSQPTGGNRTEYHCALQMRQQSEATFRAFAPFERVVSINYTSDEDGLGEPVAAGDYLSGAQFRQAVLSKTHTVLAALRFSFDVLLVDIDVVATPEFNFAEMAAMTSDQVPFVAQQDRRRGQCAFLPNSGFYLARASSAAAAHLQSVLRVSKMQAITEQFAWIALLEPKYKPLFAKPCDDTLYASFVGSAERPAALLAGHQYPNGHWIQQQQTANPFDGELRDARIVHFNWEIGMCKKWAWMRKVLHFIF